MQSAREKHRDDEPFWPRHQYGAAFGAHVAWYSRKGPQNPQNSANAKWRARSAQRQEGENE